MWISGYVTGNSFQSGNATVGEVASATDEKVSVNATMDYRALPMAAPFGIAYVPKMGSNSLVLPTEAGDVCIGVITRAKEELAPGELMLYSDGGASIVLKNDGRVLINGRAVE